jgi:pimeloyl-ACP methyl ester carboxylesterase
MAPYIETMPQQQSVNGTRLFYELSGSGDPLVLVHGSWVDHKDWQLVVPSLTKSFKVLTYDRRGHSLSERPLGPGSRREDEEDLAALIEALDLAPVHVAAHSFGASIALGLAARRPHLFRSLLVHEAPLMGIVADDAELWPLMKELQGRFESVLAQLRAGDIVGGTRRFVEEIALGPGMWEQLPEEIRQTLMNNAPAFLDELQDARWADLDLSKLSSFSSPALLTAGGQSPPWFPKIMSKFAGAIDGAERLTLADAGHAPHLTHSDEYVRAVVEYIQGR